MYSTVVLLCHDSLLHMNVVTSSLIWDSLIWAICPKYIAHSCKHPFTLITFVKRIFQRALSLGHSWNLHITACICILLYLYLLTSIKHLLSSHCTIYSDLVCWKPIFYIWILWVLEILLLTDLAFLLTIMARFCISAWLNTINLVLWSRPSTTTPFNFHW
jgi:hypothetical protein